MLRQALIAANKDLITHRARAENRQVFGTPPTLNQLRILLAIICEEIVEYQLLPVRIFRATRRSTSPAITLVIKH